MVQPPASAPPLDPELLPLPDPELLPPLEPELVPLLEPELLPEPSPVEPSVAPPSPPSASNVCGSMPRIDAQPPAVSVQASARTSFDAVVLISEAPPHARAHAVGPGHRHERDAGPLGALGRR